MKVRDVVHPNQLLSLGSDAFLSEHIPAQIKSLDKMWLLGDEMGLVNVVDFGLLILRDALTPCNQIPISTHVLD